MVGGGIHGKTNVIAISIYDHVEQLSFGKAHILAGGMLILSFIILFIYQLYIFDDFYRTVSLLTLEVSRTEQTQGNRLVNKKLKLVFLLT